MTTAAAPTMRDRVVRLVLSHVVHPIGDPVATVDDLARCSGRTLGP